MRKLLALVLAMVSLLATASSALAISWTAPETTASPFKFELYKQAYEEDFTGARHLMVISEEEAANYPTADITYMMKITVPPVQELNKYYGFSFRAGDSVELTIRFKFRNQSTSDETQDKDVSVTLQNKEQVLKFSDTTRGAEWTATVAIKASLKDILIDGAWRVAEKDYYGVNACENCPPADLHGYLFTGDCAAHSLFVSTNTAGKVLGLYVTGADCEDKDNYRGTLRELDLTLQGWYPAGVENLYLKGQCASNGDKPTSCGAIRFTRREIPDGSYVQPSGEEKNGTWYWDWEPEWKSFWTDEEMYEYFEAWCARKGYADPDKYFRRLYYRSKTSSMPNRLTDNSTVLYKDGVGGYNYADAYWAGELYSDIPINGSKARATEKVSFPGLHKTMYRYETQGTAHAHSATPYLAYGHIYVYMREYQDDRIYKMLSADSVYCDTNEKSYLSTANTVLKLLGFTFDEVVAGSIYMTEDILLSNFTLDAQIS